MIHHKQKLAVMLLCLVLAAFACGCSAKESFELPPLPTYSDEQPTPTPSFVPTASPSIKPSATPKPSAAPSHSPVSSGPSAQPSATLQPAPTVAPTPSPASDEPVLSIEGATLPENMMVYNVATLHGNVKTDKGIITLVNAYILDANGNAVQECYFTPMSASFSLAGTVNAQLRFAVLQPGYYSYVLTATADYNGNVSQKELINHGFAVYSDKKPHEEESDVPTAPTGAVYAAQITTDGSNAGQIWNFFAVYLDNPYGAAAVLANIDVESGCEPTRVQNDFTEGFMVSESFTIQIDENLIGRDGFMYSSAGEGYGPGYGLCQWSFERKGGLYDLAQERGTSVGDLDTQCMFIIMELEMQYPELLETLRTTTDVRKAAREFFYVYEQGAEMGDRPGIAEDYLEKYGLVKA